MAKKNSASDFFKRVLGMDVSSAIEQAHPDTLNRLSTVVRRPDIQIRVNRASVPYGITLGTPYGTILLDSSLTNIENVYVNGTRFTVKENGIDAIEKLVSGADTAKEVLGEAEGRQSTGRRARSGRRRRHDDGVPFENLQEAAHAEISSAGITYDNLFDELSGMMMDSSVDIKDIADELFSHKVDEPDIPRFLVYDSQYKTEIVSKVYNIPVGSIETNYTFKPVQADDSFLGRLMTSLGHETGEYDAENRVLRVDNRLITNLPIVDEKGVFSNGKSKYIPYHIGYFADLDGDKTRVERLRHIDPVESALEAVKLQYDMSNGDIKFRTLLDVSRNLPDFDKHPLGDELLEAYKKKLVFDKSYLNSNSLYAEYNGKTDDLGAVALTMLDEDAAGVIDPYGTSNGKNMGVIVYLTSDAEFNPDGTIKRGKEPHNAVGRFLEEHFADGDNFNRNQMSYNALLTSTDIKTLKVAYAEMAMFNAEDALVMTKNGAEKFITPTEENPLEGLKKVGDKMEDMHGNKSVISVVLDPDQDPEKIAERHLENAVEMARLNPDLDAVVSGMSVASRLNMGVLREGVEGERQDLKLPDGSVVKDGIVSMTYMSLPQTAEHKSKDYGLEGAGRRYSTLFRYALMSKVGKELYDEAFIDQDVRQAHIDEIATSFQRLGVTFEDENELIKPGNVKSVVDAPVQASADDYMMQLPAVVRVSLTNQMQRANSNAINIDLGDMSITSPLTNEPIIDSQGRNVLPIRVSDGNGIPFRYTEVFKHLALGNEAELQKAYQHSITNDYSRLTRKDNLLKNIDTMTVKEGAHTDVIVPDPVLGLGQVRANLDDTRVVAHRDPAIKSGNVISFENVGGGEANVMHMNPLIAPQQDKDYDGDTEGVSAYNALGLSEKHADEFFKRSCVEEQLNHYGEVYLSTGGGHFKACAKASGVDTSDITFADGKSNQELARIVEEKTLAIVDNPKSYGAYAISFENQQTMMDSLGKFADDGIKGNHADFIKHYENGYTPDENKAVLKALIAKSEWTGLAGAITNNLIASFGDGEIDPKLIRTAFDVTHTQTQSVLQMKKNADKLDDINTGIKTVKAVMSGKYGVDESREMLKSATSDIDLIPEAAVDEFVDRIVEKQPAADANFGRGVINKTEQSTAKLAYLNANTFSQALMNIVDDSYELNQ